MLIKKKILFTILISIIITGFLTLFSGCLEEGGTKNIELSTYIHNESYVNGDFISQITFIITNEGNNPTDNTTLKINVFDQDGEELYDKNIIISDTLSPGENISKVAFVNYGKNDTSLNFTVDILWDDQENQYSESIMLDDISSNVKLVNISHKDRFLTDDFYVNAITFNLKNTGQQPAHNISLFVKALDQDNNTEYENETAVAESLMHNENTTESITVDSNIVDELLSLNIEVKWDEGKNEYYEVINFDIID